MLKGPVELNSRLKLPQTVVSGPRLNDVHVLSRPLAYPAVLVRIIRKRILNAFIRAFYLVMHVLCNTGKNAAKNASDDWGPVSVVP